MTQRRLGAAIGVSVQQIQKYETGSNCIASSKLMLAADALKCDVAELLGERRGEPPGTACLIRAWSNLNDKQREAVGETTGGNRRGINGGTFYFLRLPATGLEVDLPLIGTFPQQLQPDTGVQPDITIPRTAEAIARGRDPVMEAALT